MPYATVTVEEKSSGSTHSTEITKVYAPNNIYNAIKNNINLYNIVKSAGAENAYTYLENGLPGNNRLNDVDKIKNLEELNNIPNVT